MSTGETLAGSIGSPEFVSQFHSSEMACEVVTVALGDGAKFGIKRSTAATARVRMPSEAHAYDRPRLLMPTTMASVAKRSIIDTSAGVGKLGPRNDA